MLVLAVAVAVRRAGRAMVARIRRAIVVRIAWARIWRTLVLVARVLRRRRIVGWRRIVGVGRGGRVRRGLYGARRGRRGGRRRASPRREQQRDQRDAGKRDR